MAYGNLKFLPGVNVEATPTLNEGGVAQSQLIRYRAGLIEKLGGWQKFYGNPAGSTIRALHPWQDLQSVSHLAIAATGALLSVTNGIGTTITPQLTSSSIAVAFTTSVGSTSVTVTDTGSNMTTYDSIVIQVPVAVGGLVLFGPYAITSIISANQYQIAAATTATSAVVAGGSVPSFTTTSGSANVQVTLANHGLVVGDTVNFPVATTGNGVTISGTYSVASVSGANDFFIVANATATASSAFSMNGGNVKIDRWIAPGPVLGSSGFGAGGYGSGGFGVGTASPSHSGTPITATDWALDNFGAYLIAVPQGQPLFYWDPVSGFNAMRMIPEAPCAANGCLVAMPQQQIILWGAAVAGQNYQDPLLIAWCDVGNFRVWAASSQNQAGTFRLPRGSAIISCMQGPHQVLIWTDVALWSMQYIGAGLVYGFDQVASGCGLIAPHARGVLGGAVYWMSQSQFFIYDGQGVRPLECPVWDQVFQDLATAYQTKCVCAVNSMFNEVTFYFPSNSVGSGEPDRYVKFNATLGVWDYGTLSRTAWFDQSVLKQPIGAGADGYVYQHEVSKDADGVAMNSYFVSGQIMLSEGEQFVHVDWLLPDFKWGYANGSQDADMLVTFYVRDFPESTPDVYGPYAINNVSQQITDIDFRGRLVQVRVESQDIGSFWRIGNTRYQFSADGTGG